MTPREPLRLARRDVLRLLAGVPLAWGLPRLARADEQPAPERPPALVEALEQARALGRPVLAVEVPGWERPELRLRLARRLHALLETEDEELRLALANLVVVVAERSALVGAGLRPGAGPAQVWLESTWPDGGSEPAPAGLIADSEAEAARLGPWLVARVLDPPRLAARRARELGRLEPVARVRVEQGIADLSDPDFQVRERAQAALLERREELLGALSAVAIAGSDAEARDRARALVRADSLRLEPLGTRWATFAGGCGSDDPYDERAIMMDCGMARVSDRPRRYLELVPPGPR